MGRPPIGKVAMTGAERTRLYRLKRGTTGPVTKPVTKPAGPSHDALTRELADAHAKIEQLCKAATDLSKALIEARAETMQLRKAAATAKPAKAGPAPTWDELLMEQRENSRLQKRVHDLEKALAAKPKAEKAPLPPDEVYERRIKALTTQIRNLKAERDATNQLTVEAIALAGGMPRETRIAIDKALQPDQRANATKAERDEACDKACRVWNAWKNSNDKARRPRA